MLRGEKRAKLRIPAAACASSRDAVFGTLDRNINVAANMRVYRLFHQFYHGIAHIFHRVQLFAKHDSPEVVSDLGHAEGS
jgi:hypothetical protein